MFCWDVYEKKKKILGKIKNMPLISKIDAQKLLGVSRTTFDSMLRDGILVNAGLRFIAAQIAKNKEISPKEAIDMVEADYKAYKIINRYIRSLMASKDLGIKEAKQFIIDKRLQKLHTMITSSGYDISIGELSDVIKYFKTKRFPIRIDTDDLIRSGFITMYSPNNSDLINADELSRRTGRSIEYSVTHCRELGYIAVNGGRNFAKM